MNIEIIVQEMKEERDSLRDEMDDIVEKIHNEGGIPSGEIHPLENDYQHYSSKIDGITFCIDLLEKNLKGEATHSN